MKKKEHKCNTIDPNAVKGLFVGINYRGTRSELGGCINDVLTIQKLIKETYPNAKLEIMTDDTPLKPTRDNILTKLKQLVAQSKAGDTLIFDYSGHGSQVQDLHGDETDGMDETICPIDYTTPRIIHYNGRTYQVDSQITNDEIYEIIADVPRGVKFFMLSDSCHSGTIGHLKNDFLNYQGSAVWDNCSSTTTSNNNSFCNPALAAATSINSMAQSAYPVPGSAASLLQQQYATNTVATNDIVNCRASWMYVYMQGVHQVWLTPVAANLYRAFGEKKYIIHMPYHDIPRLLRENPNQYHIVNTQFKTLAEHRYEVSSLELGVRNIIIKLANPRATPDLNASTNLCQLNLCEITSHYDPATGKHAHVNRLTGEKMTLNMRSPNGVHGGELRIISGCRENETSADTGRNGACTLAILDTVHTMQGLDQFLRKLFSHHVEDLKFIQDNVNRYLTRFGFTQHSMVSWDHSTSLRQLDPKMDPKKMSSYLPVFEQTRLVGDLNALSLTNESVDLGARSEQVTSSESHPKAENYKLYNRP